MYLIFGSNIRKYSIKPTLPIPYLYTYKFHIEQNLGHVTMGVKPYFGYYPTCPD